MSNCESDTLSACQDEACHREGSSATSEAATRRSSSAAAANRSYGITNVVWSPSGSIDEAPLKQQSPSSRRGAPSPSSSCSEGLVWKVGATYEVIPGRLSFATYRSDQEIIDQIQAFPKKCFFSSDLQESYEPFVHDFGPVNINVIHAFCLFMRKYMSLPTLEFRELVYYSSDAIDVRTNCAFLLACYLVIEHKYTPEASWAPFEAIQGQAFATFRDASTSPQDYDLTILACLRGLSRAVSLGWYSVDAFDTGEYEYLDHPSNADMHMVTPKFAAFKGPTRKSKREKVANKFLTFPPEHFVEVFRDKNITAVVRLNEPSTYDPTSFTKAGMNHYDLFFDDGSLPSNSTLVAFFDLCSKEQGVAVHCKAGLGRTGTLIAAYMIKHHGFTAAESIGWLRIVRPGSIIGLQQHYLHHLERAFATNTFVANDSTDPSIGLRASLMQDAARAACLDVTSSPQRISTGQNLSASGQSVGASGQTLESAMMGMHVSQFTRDVHARDAHR